MYAGNEPWPLCLVACYWARLPRLVYGASSHDVGRPDLTVRRPEGTARNPSGTDVMKPEDHSAATRIPQGMDLVVSL